MKLAVVRAMSHRIVVLKDGQVVEGETEALIKNPRHPYTRTLFNAANLVHLTLYQRLHEIS